jgi:cyclopropane fatty-acyl-phospholipid synthase-like methyltransferase
MSLLQHHSWENVYRFGNVEQMPWYSADLDDDITQALTKLHLSKGKILDLGCGPGTQAVALAKMGFDITATDISTVAISKAQKLAQGENQNPIFLVDDILESQITKTFDVIVDRGVFHAFSPDEYSAYIKTILRLLKSQGYLLLKCLSDAQPGEQGPHRFSMPEIQEIFSENFRIIEIRDTLFHGAHEPYPKAIFSIIQKD